MRRRISIFLIVGLALTIFAFSGNAQTRTFKWSDELCDYSGTYNSRKYTEAQLRNTVRLWMPGGFSLETSATVFKPEDLPTLNLAALDAEYKAKSGELAHLEIVNTPYWEALRKAKLAEMKQVYELSRLTIQGHRNPKVLNELVGSNECKKKYAAPLIAGGDALLTAWRTLNEQHRKINADPERLRRIFDQQYSSPDRMKYALVEVMTFGWWNCANEAIKYVEYDGSQEREFNKLFIRVRRSCSEP